MALENLVLIGIIVVIAGTILILIGALSTAKGDIKVGVGGFIGTFPFGFANDPRMLQIVIILTIVIAAAFILFALR